jgi:hypothetical protein
MVVESYTRTKYAVCVRDLSASFTPMQGTKQGDPRPPFLFDMFINSCLQEAMPGPADGVIICSQDTMRCHGLMYADDVVVLSNGVEGAQWGIKGVYEWGQKFGMDLGCDKCGMMLWKGMDEGKALLQKKCWVLDLEEDSELDSDPKALELAHKAATYSTLEGPLPTVSAYKYLGITMDEHLGDLRKVIISEHSMELDFAMIQAKKGMRQLHVL